MERKDSKIATKFLPTLYAGSVVTTIKSVREYTGVDINGVCDVETVAIVVGILVEADVVGGGGVVVLSTHLKLPTVFSHFCKGIHREPDKHSFKSFPHTLPLNPGGQRQK